jgi:hypothetical protein
MGTNPRRKVFGFLSRTAKIFKEKINIRSIGGW